MENAKEKSKNSALRIFKNQYVKLLAAVLVLYAGILTFLPSASVLRSFPILPVMSLLSGLIYKSKKTLCGFSFVLTFCMYCASGYSLTFSTLYGLLSCLLSLLGLSVCYYTLHKKKSKNTKQKKHGFATVLLLVVATLALHFAVCSDPYSASSAKKQNEKYIKESYSDTVKSTYTYYSLPDFNFRTCVEFADGNTLVGTDSECYISIDKNGVFDGVRNYAEEKMLSNSEKALSSVLSEATDAFDVLYSDIEFSDGELLSLNENAADYFDRTNYVVGLYSIMENKDDFEKLALDCAKTLMSSQHFSFNSVTLCAGNADSTLFSVCITKDTEVSEISQLIRPFDEENPELFGTTQKDFLEYWN